MFSRISILVPLVALLAACGGGGGGGGGGTNTPTQQNLTQVFNQILDAAQVVTITLKQQDGFAMTGTRVEIIKEDAAISVIAGAGNTDAEGMISFGLDEGSYGLRIIGTGNVADYTGSLTVTAEPLQTLTMQTERHTFSLDAGAELLDRTFLDVYQLDASGNVNQRVKNTGHGPGLAAATDSMAVEMFAGTYMATAYAVKNAGGNTPLLKSANITTTEAATGGTAFDLSTAGFVLTMTLNDSGGTPVGLGYDLEAYDTNTYVQLDQDTTDGTGVGSLLVGTGMSVAVMIYDTNGDIVGMHDFGAVTALQSATLQMRSVSGGVTPTSGTLVTNSPAEITITLTGTLAQQMDDMAGANIDRKIDMTPTTGDYSVDLFDGAYVFSSDSVEHFPAVTDLDVTVNGVNLTAQNITVGPGGVIHGTLLTELSSPVVDTWVNIYPEGLLANASLKRVARARADTAGVYSIEVPYGTYDLEVKGAVTGSVTVNETSPDLVVDLTRYAVTGSVVDVDGQGVIAFVEVQGGESVFSNEQGDYTITIMEGTNHICFTPTHDPVLGYACEQNVVIDDTTVANSRQ